MHVGHCCTVVTLRARSGSEANLARCLKLAGRGGWHDYYPVLSPWICPLIQTVTASTVIISLQVAPAHNSNACTVQLTASVSHLLPRCRRRLPDRARWPVIVQLSDAAALRLSMVASMLYT